MDDIKTKNTLTLKEAQKLGVSKYEFYNFIKENEYERIGRGIFIPKNELIDDLFLLSQRCPYGVFSHDEAFYYHGLTDREPLIHTITIYSGYNTSRLIKTGIVKTYFVKRELITIGRMEVINNLGNTIPVYDLERTICDLFRSRNTLDITEFNSVLKSYIRKQDKDLNKLMRYAKLFHVERVIRQYMEVLL